MTNDGGCGIIRASRPCFSVRGVIAGDNSFSIIHIAPTLYWEYCHTATICLDLISWRSDGDGAWAERRAAGQRAAEKKDVRRWNLGGKRGRNGKLKERKAWKSRFACKLCKHSSNSVCRRALAECFRNSTSVISTYCLCLHLSVKYSYIGCVSCGLERDFIFLLESHVLFLFVFLLPAPVSGNPVIKQRLNNTELKTYQAAIFTLLYYPKCPIKCTLQWSQT